MGCVADLEYVITGQGGRWRLWWQGQCCGNFPSRRAALGMAAYEAGRVRLLGHRVRILVRRPCGGFRIIPLPVRPVAEVMPAPSAFLPSQCSASPPVAKPDRPPRQGTGRSASRLAPA
ncbi:hypothetical protein QMO56_09915 [Roseomonas sp. E05]|uniref:hypothetical protein n=1 Tax=Roseomonas sp. E05 TaxID=3046310 RepID=UPI0024BBDA08|nr:hypothetical protein [Roseomonas sp. E05]MDJ0388430.1 hypothetical protein [Roseomonas sp. E05]